MIEPVAYCKQLEGKSSSHLITFNDGNDYVVKFFQPGFEKTLPNEWVSYCLARYLGLPVPYGQIVQIPQEFSSQIPELSQISNTPYQFASLYVANCINAHEIQNISHIINHHTLASVIVFDYWLYNGDRTRKNVLLQEKSNALYHLWAIDHAEVFGTYNWQQTDLEQLPVHIIKSATHQFMAGFIEEEQSFQEQVEVIQTMPILLMEEIVSLIPEEWSVSKEEKKAIVSTLVIRRKKLLPKMINNFINKVYFPIKENANFRI